MVRNRENFAEKLDVGDHVREVMRISNHGLDANIIVGEDTSHFVVRLIDLGLM